jgi:Cytochrome c554 and c-prime
VVAAAGFLIYFGLFPGEAPEKPPGPPVVTPIPNRPVVKLTSGYAGSDSCRDCHAHNHATWHASYHRTMTQVPNAENVVADFQSARLELEGHSWVLSQKGNDFFVELDDPDWQLAAASAPRVTKQIVLMTGSHHEQDFWYETSRGSAVQRLPFVYRIEEKAWYPDISVLMTPPDSPAGFGDWNSVCIQCHTTLGRPRVNLQTGFATTEVVEFGISCEACHGPGASHAERYQPENRNSQQLAKWSNQDQIVNPGKLDHRRSAATCGQCHGVTLFSEDEIEHWEDHGFRFRPGQDLSESRIVVQRDVVDQNAMLRQLVEAAPEFLDSRFWSDGMVRVVGREYNGLIKSPCFEHGEMSCLSCHDMHPDEGDPRPLHEWANDQLKLDMGSDTACLQCHAEFGQQLTEHTHHAADSSGSRCYNCHMPHTTYGLLKAVRSHQIDSPNLTSRLAAGRPTACNLCHLDKSLGWTNEYLVSWYGAEQQQLTDLQNGVPDSISLALSGDAGQRASAAWSMGWPAAQQASGTDWQGRILSTLLNDPYDVVRFIAARSLQTLPGFRDFEYDFVTSPDVRGGHSQRARETWNSQRGDANRSMDLSELIHVNSQRSATAILNELLNHRSDRRIELAE